MSSAPASAVTIDPAQTPWGRFARQFAESRLAMLGLTMLLLIVLIAVFAPWLAPQNPYDLTKLDLMDARQAPGAKSMDGLTYWLGTDGQGRDMLSAIMYGLRVSLLVGVLSGVIALTIGSILGVLAAYLGGRFEQIVMRIVDIQLGFPAILVALILLAVLGKGIDKIIIALVTVQWAYYARTARSAALVERNKEYIEAARSLGLSGARIVLRHLLPNALPPLIVVGTVQVAHAIALEATLSFLGLGLPPTEPSLGLLISNGYEYLMSGKYWISVYPGIALLLTILAINLVGDQLRDVLNPRLAKMTAPLLQVRGLRTEFATRDGVLPAVADVSFDLARGEVLGLVGESGSGKSVTGFSIIGLIDPPGRIAGGSILFDGEELVGRPQERMRALRGKRIAMIFQDPMMTLNPVLSIETQMVETVLAHDRVSRQAARARSIDALSRVGIASAAERLAQYPHQFSGGMRQRVAIAIALLHNPEVIIADEPTTALDVTVQGQILYEMQKLTREAGTALIWITHDLAVVAGLADRIAVMYAGRIVEIGDAGEVLDAPRHPYTRGLLDSVPAATVPGQRLKQISGSTPSLLRLGAGCAFRDRCARAAAACGAMPAMATVDGRALRCHFPLAAEREAA